MKPINVADPSVAFLGGIVLLIVLTFRLAAVLQLVALPIVSTPVAFSLVGVAARPVLLATHVD